MKPIDYVALFNHREQSDAIIASIGSSNVSKTKNKYSTASSNSVKNISHEVSSKISAVNESQENEPNSDVMSINQESSSFIKDIELIDKYDGKTQWR